MSFSVFSRWLHPLSCVFAVLASPMSWALADTSRLGTFEYQGETYFALSLTAELGDVDASATDIVVLVDTSASQLGVYREDSLECLRALLAGLSANDRVRIGAADLQLVPMHDAFVPAESTEAESAIARFVARPPLGATDMHALLSQAVSLFPDDGSRKRHLVYLGDGFSRANLLDIDDLRSVVNQLTEHHISVSSYAIGPQRDVAFLASLANQTGGNLCVDTDAQSAQQAGASLAETCAAPVFWPASTTWPPQFAEVLPARVPPLRADRDSIVIGRLKHALPAIREAEATMELQLSCWMAGDVTRNLAYRLTPEASNDDFSHLPRLVQMAGHDQGLTLPTLGSAGMWEARRLLLAGAENLNELGNQALAVGDAAGAKRLSEAALKQDPGNERATLLRGAAEKRSKQLQDNMMQYAEGELEPTPVPVPIDGGETFSSGEMGVVIEGGTMMPMFDDPPAAFDAENGVLIDAVEARRRAREGVLRTEVRTGLGAARQQLSLDPSNTVRDLKILLDTVETTPDISDGVRIELRSLVQSAIREGMRQEMIKERRDQLAAQNRATALERERIVSATSRREEQLQTLLNRFNNFMGSGQYEMAQEVAAAALELAPERPESVVVSFEAFVGSTYAEVLRLREIRQRNFAATMVSVERSAIPFIDDPPLVYPPADEWEALTARRKPYASADVATRNPAEERILEQLDLPTEVEFFEEPLEDAIKYLEDRHGIEIELDNAALDTLGLDSSLPITKKLAGITLRSVLRLMLKEHELTYVIRDEVLIITSQEEAENELITRVYPVGDLVIPIISGGGAGLGGVGGIGGGGFGGALNGGGGGGFGGGGGGFGGGGFGGGGFGGGGGGLGGGGFGGGGFGGGGLFDVDDPLTLGKNRTQTTSQPAAPRPADSTVGASPTRPGKVIDVTPAAGQSHADAWRQFFDEQNVRAEAARVSDADVKVTVSQLVNHKKFAEAADVIREALIAGMPQPWMFEALGTVLQLQGAPTAEIERALMSAVDLTNNADEVFFAASYFARIGLEQRALELLRDLVQLNPLRTEPLGLALHIARKSQDPDALRWTTLAALKQAWRHDEAGFAEEARRAAEALVLTLEQEGQQEQAAALREEIAAAKVRDCEVTITWSGEADLDLLVQEPGGTVCSLRDPRTTSGGVLLDDASAFQQTDAQTVSETYVCPEAFSGDYKFVIRPIWGDVTAGKVTVDVVTHKGAANEKALRQQLPIDKAPIMVQFQLDEGRRNVALDEQLVARSIEKQVAVNRSILAQSLETNASDNLADQLAASRLLAAQALLNSRFRTAVGFRPVVTPLPEGTTLSASAVISADRRYVRITPSPLFSGVTDVFTFNFATGDQGVSPNPPM